MMPIMSSQLRLLLIWALSIKLAQSCGKIQESRVSKDANVDFIVALEVPKKESMHNKLLDISDPKSPNYGKYMSLEEIRSHYGPSLQAVNDVSSYFSTIPSSNVQLSDSGDMLKVSAPVSAIENHLNTELYLHTCMEEMNVEDEETTGSRRGGIPPNKIHAHARKNRKLSSTTKQTKSQIRSKKNIHIPSHLKQHISFISLDIPTKYKSNRGKTYNNDILDDIHQEHLYHLTQQIDLNKDSHKLHNYKNESIRHKYQFFNASVTTGNEEAIIRFNIICQDGSWNQMNPPCLDIDPNHQPKFSARVTSHAENKDNPFELNTNPTEFELTSRNMFCYDLFTGYACTGIEGYNCTCITKLGPLPKYTQLRATLHAQYYDPDVTQFEKVLLGKTSLFALADVATVSFLSDLYHIPKGLTVRHGASQAIAEFYNEFYSNNDLLSFLELSGLPPDQLLPNNVHGNNPNNEANPGGEALLDLEYIMGLAPKAKTVFYSFADRNPYSYENEGFLAFLFVMGSERNPPSVLSMSYGDIEASVFNTTRPGASEYGKRCDIEFLKLGLRGVSVIFSSGDDGVGNIIMRKDKVLGCSKTWPGWPASSPYVTSVGATQLTDKATPFCGKLYSPWLAGNDEMTNIITKCSTLGETACTATNGCVITTGGGFSEVYDRNNYAPWQHDVVDNYLSQSSAIYSPGRSILPPGVEMEDAVNKMFQGSNPSLLNNDIGRTLSTTTTATTTTTTTTTSGTTNNYNNIGDSNKDIYNILKSNQYNGIKFNPYGRAFPDISAYGSNFFVYINGGIVRESGTSASAPVVAAMVTLWNDMRLAHGLPTMGFINPMLYEVARHTPEAYNDITTGNNACGVGRSLETAPCCDHAFNAIPGWDAVTGLGTMNYNIFANLIINNHTFFPSLHMYQTATETTSGQSAESTTTSGSSSTSTSTTTTMKNEDNMNYSHYFYAYGLAYLSLSISTVLLIIMIYQYNFSCKTGMTLIKPYNNNHNYYIPLRNNTYDTTTINTNNSNTSSSINNGYGNDEKTSLYTDIKNRVYNTQYTHTYQDVRSHDI